MTWKQHLPGNYLFPGQRPDYRRSRALDGVEGLARPLLPHVDISDRGTNDPRHENLRGILKRVGRLDGGDGRSFGSFEFLFQKTVVSFRRRRAQALLLAKILEVDALWSAPLQIAKTAPAD